MKALKKLSCLLLAVLLLMSVSVTAFAAVTPADPGEDGGFVLTIEKTTGTHVYQAYQIFTGDLATKDGKDVLSNVKWGNGLTDAGKAALADLADVTDVEDAAKVAEGISSLEAHAIAAAIVGKVQNPVAMDDNGDGKYATAPVAAGYYFVLDTQDDPGAEDFAISDYIVQVLGDTDMKPKADVPSVEKKVQDNDDETWRDTADWDINDTVPFQLTASLPSNYADYDSYKLVFHDTQSAGLTFSGIVSVTVNGAALTDGQYTLTTEGLEDGCTFEVAIANLKSVAPSATKDSKVVVSFNSTLNESAVIGPDGNPNTVKLEYSNNPNHEGTGHTPEDTVTVFTFQLEINKVRKAAEGDDDADGDGFVPLKGAGFTLYKWNGSEYVKVGDEVTDVTVFDFKGLDDGRYMIEETTTPPGFNTIDPIYFTVEAVHTDGTAAGLTDLKVTQVDKDGDEITDVTGESKITFTVTPATGVASTDIVNQSGLELPETGGIGTTIFYAVGGVLVVAALVLLVTKKRMSKES